MVESINKPGGRPSEDPKKSYEEAREFLEEGDSENLLKLASDEASYPEMLYFLSEDANPEIRTKVAANPSTPMQADKVLSKDAEPSVREAVGAKAAHRLSELFDDDDQRSFAITILGHLIEDEEVRVRRIIAEELKAADGVPLHIIQKLARDIDELVSTPVLHHSPILDDDELISIIQDSASTSQLNAIADRAEVSEPLAECIVETADVEAISHLLLNPSAQIRENTLDQLISSATDVPEWHEPLVMRPKLPFGAIRKIAGFVAGSLIEVLSRRNDIDDELREDLELRVQKRLAEENPAGGDEPVESLDEVEKKLRQLHAIGNLTESFIRVRSDHGDRDGVILALAILADIPAVVSRRIFVSLSAKAIMSLGWKAGVSATLVSRIQSTVGNISAEHWVLPNEDEEYPFTASEMEWQLALFLDQEESARIQDGKSLEMSVS